VEEVKRGILSFGGHHFNCTGNSEVAQAVTRSGLPDARVSDAGVISIGEGSPDFIGMRMLDLITAGIPNLDLIHGRRSRGYITMGLCP